MMKSKYDKIVIKHNDAGCITDVVGDGKSLAANNHIVALEYKGDPYSSELRITMRIRAIDIELEVQKPKVVWEDDDWEDAQA